MLTYLTFYVYDKFRLSETFFVSFLTFSFNLTYKVVNSLEFFSYICTSLSNIVLLFKLISHRFKAFTCGQLYEGMYCSYILLKPLTMASDMSSYMAK